jgi:DNA processing protein
MSARADAYVSWSALAEPADPVASWLVAALGPEGALAWTRTAGTNPVAASMELASFAPPPQVDAAIKASEKWQARLDVAEPGPHRERAARVGARVLTRADPGWPQPLDDLGATAPFALWVRGEGDAAALWGRSVAVVGARSATAYGEHVTASIAAGLVDDGWTIVSGGAYGIDAAAHRACIAVEGASIAVMAGGVDRFYPTGNAPMLEALLERGVVMSEVPPGYAPHRSRFLTRNRIIATAGATVVVEAALRSGALSTARHAAALARPLAAVPGSVTSAASAGCHALIRDHMATLVTESHDVIELAAPLGAAIAEPALSASQVATNATRSQPRPDFASPFERQAYDTLGPRGTSFDQVARGAGLTAAQARVALGGLELAGLATHTGAVWRRT